MKKIFGAFLMVMCVFVLSGCGSKKYDVTCTMAEGEGETVFYVNFNGDKMSEAKAEMILKDEETAKQMYEIYKLDTENEYKLDGKKITSTLKDFSDYEGVTKDAFIKEMEKDGFKCK